MIEAANNIELSPEEWYQICSQRPDAFAYVYFKHILRYKSSRFHFLLYNAIKRINETSYSNHIAIAAPRGNAKTQILNVILPIWCVVFNKKKHIILLSETGRQAENNLDSIRHELTANALIREHFPYAFGEGPKWRGEVITTCNGVHIVALGSGKKIRGAQKLSSRPDLVLGDDLEGDEQVLTKVQRDKLEEWFTKAVLGLAGTNEKMDVVVTGTILHPHSLLAKLLDPQRYPSWEKHRFQAVYKFSNSTKWKDWERLYINREDDNRKNTARAFYEENKEEMLEGVEVLWPEGEPYYNLMEYRINSGLRAFSQEKQNMPMDPASLSFDIEKVMFFDRQDVKIDDLIFYGSIDPASGDAQKKGDLAAIITLGKNPKTGIVYVFDAFAQERGPTDCIRYIKQMNNIYKYRKFALDVDSLKLMRDLIEKEIPGLRSRLVPYDLRLRKGKRIDRLEVPLHDGTLRIQSNQYELIEEISTYPKSEHDDVLDALEIAMRLAGNRGYRIVTY